MNIKPLPLLITLAIAAILLWLFWPKRTESPYHYAPEAPPPAAQPAAPAAPPITDTWLEADAAKAQARCTDCGCDEINVSVFVENFIREKLRSPSTADFGSDWTFKGGGSSRMTYTGYVDSQNGFGATVRTRFSVTLLCIGRSSYITDHLIY